jgi:hypothetical protein
MTIPNFEHLANTPGVIFKKFCSFSCAEEATGDMQIEIDGEAISVPVCEQHVRLLLDKPENSVID